MPITSTHPLYAKNQASWQRCRDCDQGEEALREAGTRYVPALPGMTGQPAASSGPLQSMSDYEAYVCRGIFYGATYRTVRALVGCIFTKPPQIQLPERIKDMEDDATSTGVSLVEFAKGAAGEVLLMGRAGILTDLGDDGRTALIPYKAESITNWGPDFVVLKETVFAVADPDKDPYKLEEQVQYRELRVKPEGVVCILHTKAAQGKEEFVAGPEKLLSSRLGAVPLKELPFTFVSPTSRANQIEKSPLLDLVNVNVGHWRNSVDYENGVHILGLPTPYMTGVNPKDTTPVPLGPNACVKIEDPQGKFGYAGFEGSQMGELKNAMSDKERLMAVLGARLLGTQPKGVEAAETAKIHQGGENNVLTSLVAGIEEAIERALEIAALYNGASAEDVEIEFSREFSTLSVDPQLLTSMFQVVQGGKMSDEAFVWNIHRFGLLPSDRTIQDELDFIEQAKEEKMAMALTIAKGTPDAPGGTKAGAGKPGGPSDDQGKPGEPQTKVKEPADKTSAQVKGD